MPEAAKLWVTVDANTTSFKRGMAQTQATLKATDKQVSRTSRAFGAIGRVAKYGAAGGFLALAGGAKVAYSEFREAQKVGRQTEAVLKSTGKAAGLTKKDIEGLAQSLSKKTAIDDEAIQSTENLLLTFTKIKETDGIFKRSTALALDMSVALGQDFKSSAIQMGKALNDPVKGMTALQRVGVAFTDDQKDRVAGWVEEGNVARAQKFILKELATEFGGSAKAAATPMQKLKVTLGNVAETVGSKLVPLLDKGAKFLNKFFNQMQSGKGAGGAFVKGVTTAFNAVKGAVSSAVGAIRGFLKKNEGDIKSAFKAMQNIARAIGFVFEKGLLPIIKRVFPAIKQVVEGTLKVIGGIIKTFSGILTGDFGKAWDGVKDIFGGAVKSILGTMRALTAPMRQALSTVGGLVGKVLGPPFRAIKGIVKGAFNAALGFIRSIVSAWKNVAGKVAGGVVGAFEIVSNIKDRVVGVFNKVKGVIADATAPFRNAASKAFGAIKNAAMVPINAIKDAVRGIIGVVQDAINAVNNLKNLLPSLNGNENLKDIIGFKGSAGAATPLAFGDQADLASTQAGFEAIDIGREFAAARGQARGGKIRKLKGVPKKKRGDVRQHNKQVRQDRRAGRRALAGLREGRERSGLLGAIEDRIGLNDARKNAADVIRDIKTQALDAFKSIRSNSISELLATDLDSLSASATAALDEFDAATNGMLKAFDQATKGMLDTIPQSGELKALRDAQEAERRAEEDVDLQKGIDEATKQLIRARRSNSPRLIAAAEEELAKAEDAREDVLEERRATQLEAEIDAKRAEIEARREEERADLENQRSAGREAVEAYWASRMTAREEQAAKELAAVESGTDPQVATEIARLNAVADVLDDNLGQQKGAYAQFVKDVNKILAGLNPLPFGGDQFEGSFDDESAFEGNVPAGGGGGRGRGKKKGRKKKGGASVVQHIYARPGQSANQIANAAANRLGFRLANP